MNPETDTLCGLFGGALNGTLSEEQCSELTRRLKADPAARALWFAFNDVECALSELPAFNAVPTADSSTLLAMNTPFEDAQTNEKAPSQKRWIWAGAAAAVAVALGGIENARHSESAQRVARFTRMQDALWASPTAAFRPEKMLRKGEVLELLSGEVQIRFESGAEVTLYAPCIFQPTSHNGGFLTFGQIKASAASPEARGFVIQTPTARLVDVGTEFTASTGADGQSRIEVTSGEVKVHVPSQTEPRSVRQGQSLSIDNSEQRVLTRLETGDGSPAFRLPSIEPPSTRMAGEIPSGTISARLLRGTSGISPVDSNITGAAEQQVPTNTLKTEIQIIDQSNGRIVMDLGSLVSVTKINAYSWHRSHLFESESHRPAQNFVLYASENNTPPVAIGNLESQGWQIIGRVDSDKFFGVEDPRLRSEQQACSFTSATGCIGRYRYLLWLPAGPSNGDRLADLKSAASRFEVYAEPWSF